MDVTIHVFRVCAPYGIVIVSTPLDWQSVETRGAPEEQRTVEDGRFSFKAPLTEAQRLERERGQAREAAKQLHEIILLKFELEIAISFVCPYGKHQLVLDSQRQGSAYTCRELTLDQQNAFQAHLNWLSGDTVRWISF